MTEVIVVVILFFSAWIGFVIVRLMAVEVKIDILTEENAHLEQRVNMLYERLKQLDNGARR